MNIQTSKNGRWLQVKGVHKDDKATQQVLRDMGFRWQGSPQFHWWGPNTQTNLAALQQYIALKAMQQQQQQQGAQFIILPKRGGQEDK